jgi:hypothetical protein
MGIYGCFRKCAKLSNPPVIASYLTAMTGGETWVFMGVFTFLILDPLFRLMGKYGYFQRSISRFPACVLRYTKIRNFNQNAMINTRLTHRVNLAPTTWLPFAGLFPGPISTSFW